MNKAKGKPINFHTVNSVQTSGNGTAAVPSRHAQKPAEVTIAVTEWKTTEPIHDPQFRLYNPHIHPL